jgi:hypothetical protein
MNKSPPERNHNFTDFPKNRFEALGEAEKLLRFKPIEWEYLLQILQKADGWLSFRRGGIDIEWMRHKENDKLHLSFIVATDHIERSVVYTFNMQELARFRNKIQLGIEDCETE